MAPNYYLNANCIASYYQRKKSDKYPNMHHFTNNCPGYLWELSIINNIRKISVKKTQKMHIILIYKYVLGLVDLFKTYLYILGHFDSISLYNNRTNLTKYPQMHVIVNRYLYSRHISLFTLL